MTSWIRRLPRLLVYVLVFGLCLELLARVDDRVRWGAPILAPYSLDGISLQGRGAPRNRPHAAFQNFRINNHGFRGDDFPLDKPPGVIRVAIVGASETFGLYESPGHEYPVQVQRILDRRAPGRYHVINAASIGMTPPRIREFFHQWLSRFQIDILFFYPTPVFYVDHLPPREADFSPVARPPAALDEHWTDLRLPARAWTTLRQRLPDALQTRLKEYVLERQRRALGHAPWQEAPPDRSALFRRHLEELVTDVSAAGVTVVLGTHANRFLPDWPERDRDMMVGWVRFFPDATPEGLLDMEAQGNAAVREVAREYGLAVADVAATVTRDPSRFADFSHFTDQGAREAATVIAEAILVVEPRVTGEATDGAAARMAPAPDAPKAPPARP